MADVAHQIERGAAAWDAGDWATVEDAARVLGFVLDAKMAKRLDVLLQRAQGSRTSRLMTRADLLAVLAEAARAGLAQRDAGRASVGKMVTTVALAVRHGGKLTVGVTATGAISGAAGRAPAWDAELRPWSNDLPKNAARCLAWAKQKIGDRISLTALDVETPAQAESSDALLAAVLAAPRDDRPRRVYADWLLERGDPRGELISVQCDLAQRPDDAALRAREAALLRAHEAAWLAAFKKLARTVELNRGFVESATLSAAAFEKNGPELFAAAPILSVRLLAPSYLRMDAVAANPLLGKLDALHLGGLGAEPEVMGPPGLAMLVKSPHVTQLRTLTITGQRLGAAAAMLNDVPFARLETLGLFGNQLGPDGAKLLAVAQRLFAHVRSLDVRNNQLTDAGVAALARAKGVGAVESLMIGHETIGPAAVEAVMGGTLTSLRALWLGWSEKIGDAGLEAMARSPRFGQLKQLEIPNIGATALGIAALAASPHAGALEVLDLSSNAVGEDGARALLESPHLNRLRVVKCAAKGIAKDTLAALTERRGRIPSTG